MSSMHPASSHFSRQRTPSLSYSNVCSDYYSIANFSIISNNHPPSPVYAPWCGHCKTLAPKFEEAAAALKDQEIRLAKIDCTESNNAKLCADYGVEGYPTLKVVTNNNLEKLRDYNGARNTPRYAFDSSSLSS